MPATCVRVFMVCIGGCVSMIFVFGARCSPMAFFVVFFFFLIKIHSSCEIEDFVETYLCKLCVILRSRVLRVVYPH